VETALPSYVPYCSCGLKELSPRPVATQHDTAMSLSAPSLIINEPVVTIFRRQRAFRAQTGDLPKSRSRKWTNGAACLAALNQSRTLKAKARTHAGRLAVRTPPSRRDAATSAAAVVQIDSGLEQLRAALIGSVGLMTG